jgi:CheY-like chemotaxis protein/predicted regulator of Ras-like GTPase activity (Roadblock/LC7/MglB family)
MEQTPTTAQLLVVDDEEELLWSVSQRLRKERPAYRVSTATSGHDALDLLARTPFDVLVADLRMPAMSGMDLVLAARSLFPRLPVIVMTAYPSREIREKVIEGGAIEFLEKPFDFGHFVGALERAVTRGKVGFSGAILVQTLPDIIQLYALSNSTGALEVQRPDRSGTIWFDRGIIPHAVAGSKTGASAFYEIMTWQGGSFSMRAGEVTQERTISAPWMELLMEACRLSDEDSRSAPAADPESTDGELHSGWTLAPPALPTNRPPDGTSTPPTGLETNTQEGTVIHMANYKDSLSKLDSLDGFIGACLCDSESGMVLATEGGGPLNLEVAGATNSEVVRAKRKAAKALNLKDDIEDILITLGKQYHLVRPLKTKPNVFFYLALDRTRSNLGMARITLADVERDLVL